jgi:hypothetical protein
MSRDRLFNSSTSELSILAWPRTWEALLPLTQHSRNRCSNSYAHGELHTLITFTRIIIISSMFFSMHCNEHACNAMLKHFVRGAQDLPSEPRLKRKYCARGARDPTSRPAHCRYYTWLRATHGIVREPTCVSSTRYYSLSFVMCTTWLHQHPPSSKD